MKNNLKYIPLFAWGHFGRGLGLLLLNNKNMREKNTDMGNGVCFMNEPFLVFFYIWKSLYLITLFLFSCVCVCAREGEGECGQESFQVYLVSCLGTQGPGPTLMHLLKIYLLRSLHSIHWILWLFSPGYSRLPLDNTSSRLLLMSGINKWTIEQHQKSNL